jgi:endonuclease/exonuclease/phosphatase family metal-dependent hydrolase
VGLVIAGWFQSCLSLLAASVTVATYNVENYLLSPAGTRPAKSPTARTMVQRSLETVRADVVALQEISGVEALTELRDSLRQRGLDYPHLEWVSGYDTNIQVAFLSRFPIVASRPHTNEGFLLRGRRFRTSRGFAEIEVRPVPGYRLVLVNAHLKSRRDSAQAAQDEIREQEALLLRRLVDERLRADPNLNLVVLGDFNDLKSAATLRILRGRGKLALVDPAPPEMGESPNGFRPGNRPRPINWTHYFARDDTYSRVDYILLSSGAARELDPAGTYVLAMADWGIASDHRPVVVRLSLPDR